MQQPDVLQATRVLVAQLFLTLFLTAAALPFGLSVASSVLIGAVVCLLANSIFAFLVFRRYRAQEPGLLVMRFYGAEVVKLSLVLGSFAVALAIGRGLSLPAMLVAYFAVQVLPTVFAFAGNGREDAHKTRER